MLDPRGLAISIAHKAGRDRMSMRQALDTRTEIVYTESAVLPTNTAEPSIQDMTHGLHTQFAVASPCAMTSS